MTQPSLRTVDALRDADPPALLDRSSRRARTGSAAGRRDLLRRARRVGGGLTGLWAAIEARANDPAADIVARGGRDHRLRRLGPQRRLLLRVPDARDRARRRAVARGPARAAAHGPPERARDRRASRASEGIDAGSGCAGRPPSPRSRTISSAGERRMRSTSCTARTSRSSIATRCSATSPRRPTSAACATAPEAACSTQPPCPGAGRARPASGRADLRVHPGPLDAAAAGASRWPPTPAASGRAASCSPRTPIRRCCAGSGFASCPSTTTCSSPSRCPRRPRQHRVGAGAGAHRRRQPVPLLPAHARRSDPLGRVRRDLLLRQPHRRRPRAEGRLPRPAGAAVLPDVPAARGAAVHSPLGGPDRLDVAVHARVRHRPRRTGRVRRRLHRARASPRRASGLASPSTCSPGGTPSGPPRARAPQARAVPARAAALPRGPGDPRRPRPRGRDRATRRVPARARPLRDRIQQLRSSA